MTERDEPAGKGSDTDESSLRAFLSSRDVPCPGCGYNLRGLPSEVCPECRQVLRLTVQLAEPRLGPFLCGAIGLGGGIGFNGLILGWETSEWLSRGWPRLHREALPLVVSLCVLSVLLWIWLRCRSWIRRQHAGLQWFLGAWAWVLMLISAVWFFVTAG